MDIFTQIYWFFQTPQLLHFKWVWRCVGPFLNKNIFLDTLYVANTKYDHDLQILLLFIFLIWSNLCKYIFTCTIARCIILLYIKTPTSALCILINFLTFHYFSLFFLTFQCLTKVHYDLLGCSRSQKIRRGSKVRLCITRQKVGLGRSLKGL